MKDIECVVICIDSYDRKYNTNTHGIIPGGKSRKPMIASLDKPHRITAGQNNICTPKMLNGFGAIKSLSLSIFHYQNLIVPIVPC